MGADRAGFVWPPSPLPEEGAVVTAAEDAGSVGGRGGARASVLIELERTWLDPVAEPFDRRAASIGWARDSPEAYCDRCGHDVAAHEASEFGCAACRGRRPAWERFVRLGAYEPPLSLWIQEVKFTRFHALARAMGHELGVALREAGVGELGAGVVVPVPTTFRRRVARGIDHAGAIAAGVGAEVGLPVRWWLRRAHRASQRAVAPSARAANVRGAFRVARGVGVAGRSVVLVDDVSTSGATVRACARVLRRGGARRVWVACLGVTREAGRVGNGGSAGEGMWTTGGGWGKAGGPNAGS